MFLYIYIVLLLEIPAAVLGVTVDQGPKALVKGEGKTVYLPCKVTGLGSSDYIHWYQIKEGEAPSRLLYINQGGIITLDTNNPQANDFTVEKTKLYDLKLRNTQKRHAAAYFCTYWDSSSHNSWTTDVDMALSGMITFGLLVVLIDCLNGQITHPDPVIIKASGRAARIQCKVDSSTLQSSVLHWYRAPPKGALQRLMYFEAGSSKAKKDPDTPRRFSGSVNGDLVALTISKLELSDAGSYYCALWSGDNTVFGPGTRLVVTDPKKETVTAPELTGYRTSKKNTDNHGKQTMLCHASGMVPDFVTFKWQEKSGAGQWTDVSEENVVEQRKESPAVTVTSMVIVDKNMAENKDYQCNVTHEGNTENPSNSLELKKDKNMAENKDYQCNVTHEGNTENPSNSVELKKENSKPAKESKNDAQNPTCPPSTAETIKKQISGDSEQIPSMFLFVYAYGVMLMKNGLFFCIVSIFQLKRKAGKNDKSSET
ncbi:uncharacterized protein LOC107713967 [Sinocyclocheilus rhinocerous]|uniref:uncharacterized protein LOC107713967 n=1 Tax=Sinocyclocheilus rhinocerous TaxID=307959 RepID=UPI0007B83197|nr:PREDICTED: uncharacterized protein LOC107713967 [Sinocyclocheilus rhinocerous]